MKTKLKKLTREQYNELEYQFYETPDLSDSFAPSGQHYTLNMILKKFGYDAADREDIMNTASRLLELGYEN